MRRLRRAGALIAAVAAAAIGVVFAAPASAEDLPGGWIRNNDGNHLCLQPEDGLFDAGVPIVQVECDTTSLIQRWESINHSADHSVFQLQNLATELCLDAMGSATDGTPVVQWPCNSISNEQWDLGPDFVHLRSRVSGTTSHCLDVPWASADVGLRMQIFRCNNTTAQIWDTFGPEIIIT